MLDLIRDALETYDFVGVRGLPSRDASKKYRKNQFLAKSYTHYDDGPEEQLSGTSAVHVRYEMEDNRILQAIKEALSYADTGKVILIAGDYCTEGIDHGEIIIGNEVHGEIKGAKFLGYIKR